LQEVHERDLGLMDWSPEATERAQLQVASLPF
jgi:hypothetical protein